MSLQEFVMGIKEMPRLARFIPKIMLAITVTACDEVYRKIACWLNDMGESDASSLIQTNSRFRAEALLLKIIFIKLFFLLLIVSFELYLPRLLR